MCTVLCAKITKINNCWLCKNLKKKVIMTYNTKIKLESKTIHFSQPRMYAKIITTKCTKNQHITLVYKTTVYIPSQSLLLKSFEVPSANNTPKLS